MTFSRLLPTVACLIIALLNVACWSAGSTVAQEQAAQAKPDKPVRMLFVTQSGGFRHGSVTRKGDKLAPAEEAMTQLGLKSNLFRVDCTQDVVQDFTKDNLQNYDIVMFYTTGDRKQLPIAAEALQYFLNDWLKQKGHGFIGAHSAADTYADYEPYWDMLGGSFNGHPWGSGERVTVTVHDTEHPISKPWGSEFEIQDEIYRFKNWQPEKVRVLMSLNMAKTRRKEPYHVPIAWCKEYGDGKMFHMSLGHNEHVWENDRYLQSMLGGIKWILGMEKGDATPNPELSKAEEAKAKAVVAATKTGSDSQ
ncbi:MAG: ThuA domain-containing protein [Pirellulales bacterium]